MKKLEDLGVENEITGQRKNRVYQAKRILALLDAATGSGESDD